MNTGNFRIGRQIVGKPGTRTILYTFDSSENMLIQFNALEKEFGWDYYCEEEVIFKETHRDENGNLIDSAPTWRRMNN